MNRIKTWAGIAVMGCSVILAGCSSTSKERFDARVTYVLEPTQPLPDGLKTVAILDAGVETGGGADDARARKWATIAADMMEKMIQDAAANGSKVTIAKRRDTSKLMAEKDLQLSGLVDASEAARAGKMMGVEALITSKLNIQIDVKEGKATTIDVTDLYGGGWRHGGWGGGHANARETGEVSRNLTVQCSFALMDATTGQALVQYAPKPFRKHDKASPGPIFGSSKGEEDLDPVDGTIGQLVEQGTREFVSMIVPCQVDYMYEVKSGTGKGSDAAVRLLRADDYAGAMQLFQSAVAADPEDHRSIFNMGVTSELMGNWESALKYYRQAVAMPGLDKEEVAMYTAAKDRVAAHKDRIRKTGKKA